MEAQQFRSVIINGACDVEGVVAFIVKIHQYIYFGISEKICQWKQSDFHVNNFKTLHHKMLSKS